MSRFIVKTVDIVFIFFLGLVSLSIGTATVEYALQGWKALVGGIVVLCFVFASLYFLRNIIRRFAETMYHHLKNISPWKLALILGLTSLITKVFFCVLFDTNTDMHTDMRMYRSFATQFAQNGYIKENADYATYYPYTLMWGLVMAPFAKLFGSDVMVFTIAHSVFISITLVLLYDIIRKYTGKEIAFAGLTVYTLLPLGLFQTQVIIHENGLLFFHVLAFWFFQKVFDKKYNTLLQILFMILAGVFVSVGKSINASGQIIVISFAIYAVAKIFADGFKAKKMIKLMSILLILAICFVGASILTDIIVEKTVHTPAEVEAEPKAAPYAWTIYLGYNYEECGIWNDEDNDTFYAFRQMDSQEEANAYQKELIMERLQPYFDAPYKFFVLYFNKIKHLLGRPFIGYAYNFGNEINSFFCNGAHGLIHKGCMVLNAVAFMYMYAIMFISKISGLKKKSAEVKPDTHFQMVLIGITLILLLIGEVNAKYGTQLHAMMFAAALISVKPFFNDSLIYRTKAGKQKLSA